MLDHHFITTDLCVVGGGLAGMCAAIAAARAGSKVVLMQERPVLGRECFRRDPHVGVRRQKLPGNRHH